MSFSTISLVGNKGPDDVEERDQETLISDIREAQNKAMVTEKCGGLSALHFGVRFSSGNDYEVYCANSTGEVVDRTVSVPGLTEGRAEFIPPHPTLQNYQSFSLGSTVIQVNPNGSIDIF